MVVYLDVVLLLNGVLDYLLLMVCGSVTASPIRRTRAALAGGLGGIYAAVSLVPGFSFLGNLLWQMVFAALLCLTAFGPGRCLLRQSVVLWLLAAAFSGIVLLMTELFSAPAALVGSRVYYPVSFGVLVLTAGGAYSLMRWGLGRLRHHGGDVVQVEIIQNGRKAVLNALRDTGNTLRDPVSGCQVLVADWTVLRRLLPETELERTQFSNPVLLMEWLRQTVPDMHTRLIPYKTVGVEHGMLLAMRPQEVKISGKREMLLLAFSPVPVSDGGGYEALLGGVT